MGYTTDFSGGLTLSKPLTEEQFNYLDKFSQTRRMKRDVNKLMKLYNGKFGYPGTSPDKNTPEEIYGNEGEYFVGGQQHDDSIIDYNTSPGLMGYDNNVRWEENQNRIKNGVCQPGLWCQWCVVGDVEQTLEWDGGEKFYNYVEWLQYLINHFFEKWGVLLNGEIEWIDEDDEDRGCIRVVDNVITIGIGKMTYDFND